MKKKTLLSLLSVLLVAAIGVSVAGAALAAETDDSWHPSRTQTDAAVVEEEITTADGETIYVTVDPVKDTAGEVVNLAEYDEPWIKVTPVADTIAANDLIDEEHAHLDEEERHPLLTETALLYSTNARVNELYEQVLAAGSTAEFLSEAAPNLLEAIEEATNGETDAYTPLALYDISASAKALELIGDGKVSVKLEAPGVTEDSDLLAVRFARDADDEEDEARLLDVVAGDEEVTLTMDADSFGPVMILVRA